MDTKKQLPGLNLLLLSTSSEAGGGPQVVLDLAGGLRKKGFNVEVALPADGVFVSRFQALGIPTHLLPFNKISPISWIKLIKLMRAQHYNILHSHGKGAGLAARVVGLITRTPVVHTHHGIHLSLYSKAEQWIYIRLERLLSLATWRVVNVSKSQEAAGLFYKLFPAYKSRVIYNSASVPGDVIDKDKARLWLQNEFGLPQDCIIFTLVARFDPVKNHLWFLSAYQKFASEHPNARLLLVGDGELLEACRELVIERNMENQVIIAGLRSDVFQIMLGSDVFVLPSLREGLPLTLIEAMFAGLPLVGSNTVGINEVVMPGLNGLLFELGNEEGLIEALQNMMSQKIRKEYGGQGYNLAVKKFSMDKFIDQHVALYREAIKL